MGPVLEVEHLHKRYGDFVAVDDVSFSVEEGEIFGILGPNGAGKTTTVECLQGLRDADRGRMQVLGYDPRTDAASLRREIGSQLQESALPDRIKVWEALELFSSMTRDGPEWEAVLAEWDLSAKRNATFGSLSGGQQQRLFIALAVVNAPRLVFLDEMTTGLDPMARHATWEMIRKIRSHGTTVVLVTHFMDEAEELCDRIAVIDGKRVAALDTVDGLIERYAGSIVVTFATRGADVEYLHRLEEVDTVTQRDGRTTVTGHGPLVVAVATELSAHGLRPPDLGVKRSTLEDVFLSITGSAG